MDQFKRQPIIGPPSHLKHFDDRKTGRDQYDPSIQYGPNYKPSRTAAVAEERRRFEQNKNKQKRK